jgi:hypothetical protein
MGGWRRAGLDDAFPIRQALPVGARFWCWARWARISIEKCVYYSGYIYPREGLGPPLELCIGTCKIIVNKGKRMSRAACGSAH